MSLTVTDSENLARIADALERLADAEEKRNKIVARDIEDRHEAWAEQRERSERVFDAIVNPQPRSVAQAPAESR